MSLPRGSFTLLVTLLIANNSTMYGRQPEAAAVLLEGADVLKENPPFPSLTRQEQEAHTKVLRYAVKTDTSQLIPGESAQKRNDAAIAIAAGADIFVDTGGGHTALEVMINKDWSRTAAGENALKEAVKVMNLYGIPLPQNTRKNATLWWLKRKLKW